MAIRQSKLVWLMAAIGAVLLVVIVLLAMLLLSKPAGQTSSATPTPSSQTSANGSSGSSLNKGTVSSLSGGVVSYQNLKGLTLRINQIDTCAASSIAAYVSVSAQSGDVNTSFSKKNVKVYLDGQELNDFDFGAINPTQAPLANMLAVDVSGSMSGTAISNARQAAASYIDRLKPNDQVGLIQFNQTATLRAGLSATKTAARAAATGLVAGGNTAIYDALNLAITNLPACGRKAVTVLTDGEDTASKSTLASVKDAAAKANLPIFAVGIKGSGFNPGIINALASGTGGQYLEANTPAEISSLYQKIDSQLTGQFVANLKVPATKNGTVHTLKIISTIEGSDTSSERAFVF